MKVQVYAVLMPEMAPPSWTVWLIVGLFDVHCAGETSSAQDGVVKSTFAVAALRDVVVQWPTLSHATM